jgi:NTE family protein
MNSDAVSRSAETTPSDPPPERVGDPGARKAAAQNPRNAPAAASEPAAQPACEPPPRQIVLVLQGGGALGAYQAGVYQGLCEAGVVPDWVIGTSIGAINGAIIAGNPTDTRMRRLQDFWAGLAGGRAFD